MNGSEYPLEVFSPPASGGAGRLVPRETKKRGSPETPAPRRLRSVFALLFALALVAGCGGEDSSTSAGGENRGSLGAPSRSEPDSRDRPQEPPPPPSPPPSTQTRQPSPGAPQPPPAAAPAPSPVSDLSWHPGAFSPSGYFRHFCADPSRAFNRASRRGSSVHEKHWLRSWSRETYLWYDEIEDVDPTGDHSVSDYFHLMKTGGTLSSGAPKDDFHFTQNTREHRLLTESGVSAGYGVRFVIIRGDPPRDIAVAYVEPGSPAAAAGLARGARILEVDGVDAVNGADTAVIYGGLNPSAVSREHRFSVRDLGASEPRSVSMTSAEVTRSPVQHVKVVETASGERVGYFLFNNHIRTAEGQLASAVNTLSEGEGIDDLVIDLRYNPGGLISVASRLAFMVAGPTATDGKTFARVVRNDKLGDIPIPFHSVRGGAPLPSLDLDRVFVLTGDGIINGARKTPRTCSASESMINGLEGIDVEVIRVGSTTCGKPYGFYPADNCGTTYFTIQLQTVNDKGFGDYQAGFAPTCEVAGDDFDHSFGDPEEKLLKTALAYQADDECPAAESSAALRGSLEETRSPGLVLGPSPREIEGAILGR